MDPIKDHLQTVTRNIINLGENIDAQALSRVWSRETSARQKTLNFALEIEKTHLSRQRSGLIQLKLVKAPLLLCLFEIHSHLR